MAPITNDNPKVAPASTSDGFKKLFIDRFGKYTQQTPAAGLFYLSNAKQPSCRIECTDKRIEFVDVAEFGTDPDGTLFYNNIGDLSGAMDYRFWHNSGTTDEEAAVVAQFYKKGSDVFVAEFVGKDPARTVKDTVVDHTGHWRPFSFQENTAAVSKKAGSTTMTLSISVSGQRATWTVADSAKNTVINQSGKVLIKNLGEIGAGRTSYIDYNDDRILFYPRVHSPDFSIVFLPIIADGGDFHALHSQQVGTSGGSFTQVTWS
ncbi:hypothetical protein SCHPADRAFT_906527 [Schizopora paradoxa]|uniref:Uncharacterized protein n=1 Tax=Schizopora paradoxa TaxID=27342 RepID=A0A0H2RG42_9AGAM|nr:hypothetical protein SCHPADRAFT_906527 [Schizopora paradoxa]